MKKLLAMIGAIIILCGCASTGCKDDIIVPVNAVSFVNRAMADAAARIARVDGAQFPSMSCGYEWKLRKGEVKGNNGWGWRVTAGTYCGTCGY